MLEAVSEVEEHSQQSQGGDDQIFEPGGDHDRFPIASYGTGEQQTGKEGDDPVMQQCLDQHVYEKRIQRVQEDVKDKIS